MSYEVVDFADIGGYRLRLSSLAGYRPVTLWGYLTTDEGLVVTDAKIHALELLVRKGNYIKVIYIPYGEEEEVIKMEVERLDTVFYSMEGPVRIVSPLSAEVVKVVNVGDFIKVVDMTVELSLLQAYGIEAVPFEQWKKFYEETKLSEFIAGDSSFYAIPPNCIVNTEEDGWVVPAISLELVMDVRYTPEVTMDAVSLPIPISVEEGKSYQLADVYELIENRLADEVDKFLIEGTLPDLGIKEIEIEGERGDIEVGEEKEGEENRNNE